MLEIYYVCHVIDAVKDDGKIEPAVIRAYIGALVSFNCDSYMDTIWQYGSSTLTGNTELSSKKTKLTIFGVNILNKGFYSCYGLNYEGTRHFVAKAELKVYGKFSITLLVII